MKLFRNKRGKLLEKKKFGNYIVYAIGEIILVVIGILIAVSLNNWNESRKEKNKLLNIYNIVADDLENDIKEIDKMNFYYDQTKPIFNKILKDSARPIDYAFNPQYIAVMIGFPEITFNKRGYNQLTAFNTDKFQDSLPTQIIEFYTERLREIKIDDDMRSEDMKENYTHFKKNYTWWADVINMRPNKDFIDYVFNDPDYKNRMATINFMAYQVFLPELATFKRRAEVILEEINKRRETAE
jgi:site-specific DNA-adenine methylase